jgi:Domain of unknown function (DUF4173)
MSATPVSHEQASFARRALLHAVLLGALADALLRDPPWGIGLLVWMIAFAGTVVALAWKRGHGLSREQGAWLFAALFFAGNFAWRDSEALQFYDFVGMLGALLLLGATVSRASAVHTVLGTRVRDLVMSAARIVGSVTHAVLILLFRDSALDTEALRGSRWKAGIRGALIALPLLLLFGVLLSQADPVFASVFSLPNIDFGRVLSHLVVAGFFTWIVGGWLRGALVDERSPLRLPEGIALKLGTTETTIVLGALNVLFALFVAVQIGWLFGGEALVRRTTGLGYAQYARRGFFELVWVSLLVLPVLLGTRAAIPSTDEVTLRRHRQLAVPLIVLLGAMMISAAGRMQLYVQYYGLTVDRVFAMVFMGWLALVFVWLALTVLRGRARDFAAGMTVSGFAVLAALNVTNPEALVARVNIARAPRAASTVDSLQVQQPTQTATPSGPRSALDVWYLANLGGDATPYVVSALLAPPVAREGAASRQEEVKLRCNALKSVLTRWVGAPAGDWRRWNVSAQRARRVVVSEEAKLRSTVTCLDDGVEKPFGDREKRDSRSGEQWYVPKTG